MAVRTWSSAASTDMNDTANYSGAGSFATDDLVFDATSTVNAAATAAITCNSITITNGYTGTWALTGYTATCAAGFSDDGITGAHNYGNGITCNGASSTFHVGSGVGTITATSCVVTMNGTTAMVFDDDKGASFSRFILGASAVVTSSGAATSTLTSTGGAAVLTLGNNSSLTVNRAITFRQTTIAASMCSFPATYTFNGTALIVFQNNVTGTTFPAMTYTGSGTIQYSSTATTTFTFAGNQVLSGPCKVEQFYSDATTTTIDFATYNLTCTTFTVNKVVAAQTVTVNFGSGTYTISSFSGGAVTGTTNLNFQTSVWVCTGAWTHNANHTIDEGTSSVTFSGTGATNTVTSNGKKFYDVTLNKTATAGVTFADATSLHALTVSATNTQAISWTGTTMTASGDITIDGSGTLNCGNGIAMNGASATLHVGSTVGTVTASSCAVTMNGTTGMTFDDDKGISIANLVLGASAKVTMTGAVTITFSGGSVTPLTAGNNSTLTVNTNILSLRRTTSAGNMYSFGTGCTFNGSSNIQIRPTNLSVNLPAFTYTGSGTITIYELTTGSTHTQTGNISSTAPITIYSNTAGQTTNFNQGSYTIDCTTFTTGANNATSTFVGNFSNSITCTSFVIVATGTQTINMDDSVVSVSGSITIPAAGTFSPQTSTFTVTNTSTVTSNGKSFYNFAINAAAKTITLADALNIASGGSVTVTAFTAFAGNQYIIFAGSGSITIGTNVSNRLRTAVAGSTITWNTGASKWTFPAYTAGDWQGSAASKVRWVSSSPGTYYNVAAPAGVVSSYMSYTDTNNSTGTTIDAMNGTNQNGGHTVNINFPPSGSGGQRISRSRIAISMGI